MTRRLLSIVLASLAACVAPLGGAAAPDTRLFDSGVAATRLLDGETAAVATAIGRELTDEFRRRPAEPQPSQPQSRPRPQSPPTRAATAAAAPPSAANASAATTAYPDSRERRQRNYARFVERAGALDAADGADLAARLARIDLIELSGRQMPKYGLRLGDAADAYALWWLLAWEAAHGDRTDKTDQQVVVVRDQVARVMLGLPAFLALDDAKRQELAEALLIQGALVNQTQRRHERDAAASRAVARVVREAARAHGLDLDAMTIPGGAGGFLAASAASTDAQYGRGAERRAAADVAGSPRGLLDRLGGALSRGVARLRGGAGCLVAPGTPRERFAPTAAPPADAKALAGRYRCREGGLSVSLRLDPDGRFAYEVETTDPPDPSRGRLQGLWRLESGELVLSAEPGTRPAVTRLRAVRDPAVAMSVAVIEPDGGPARGVGIRVDLSRSDQPVGYLFDGTFRAAPGEKLHGGQEGDDPPRAFRLTRSADGRELLRVPVGASGPNSFLFEYRPSDREPFDDIRVIVVDARQGVLVAELGLAGALLRRTGR